MTRKIQARLGMDADHPVYRTHFPGMPRTPGSLVIQAFLDLVGREVGDGAAVTVRHFRFRSFLEPGVHVFEVVLDEERGRAECRVPGTDRPLVEGVLEWRR